MSFARSFRSKYFSTILSFPLIIFNRRRFLSPLSENPGFSGSLFRSYRKAAPPKSRPYVRARARARPCAHKAGPIKRRFCRGNVLQTGHVVNLVANRGYIQRDAARCLGIWVRCEIGITAAAAVADESTTTNLAPTSLLRYRYYYPPSTDTVIRRNTGLALILHKKVTARLRRCAKRPRRVVPSIGPLATSAITLLRERVSNLKSRILLKTERSANFSSTYDKR